MAPSKHKVRIGLFSRFSISVKMSLLAGITLASFGGVLLVATRSFSELSRSVADTQKLQGGLVRKISDLESQCFENHLALLRAAKAGQGPAGAAAIAALQDSIASAQSNLASILATTGAATVGGEALPALVSAMSGYIELLGGAESELSAGPQSADAFVGEAEGVFLALRQSFDSLTAAVRDAGSLAAGSAKALASSSSTLVVAFVSAAMVLVGLVSVFSARSITVPMTGLLALLGRLGAGDLGIPDVARGGRDELTRMGARVGELAAGLRSLVGTVKERLAALEEAGRSLASTMEETGAAVTEINANIASTHGQLDEQSEAVADVSSAIEELARGVDALDSMISRQAEVLSQSSAAVEEMIASVDSAVGNAERASEAAALLVTEGKKGRAWQDEVAESVASIVRYADNLGEAARVITEIADRTNLLAMNAAIEAAHAGESGRGFAVVAEEIRRLAEQASTQSKDISEDLSKVATSIESVRGSSSAAAESFIAILDRAQAVGDSAGVIGGSLSEQRQGGAQVLEGLERLRDITAEIRRGSSEMAAGNSSILGQVGRLKNVNDMVMRNNEEITQGTKAINDAVVETRELSSRTTDLIGDVKAAAGKFRL